MNKQLQQAAPHTYRHHAIVNPLFIFLINHWFLLGNCYCAFTLATSELGQTGLVLLILVQQLLISTFEK